MEGGNVQAEGRKEPVAESGPFASGQSDHEKADSWGPYLQRVQQRQEQKQKKADEKPPAIKKIEGLLEKVEQKTGLHILPAQHTPTHLAKAD